MRTVKSENAAFAAEVLALRLTGLSMLKIAAQLNSTKGRVAGILYRALTHPERTAPSHKPDAHPDCKYIEPWAVYSARKRRERAATKSATTP